ncbi:hypothetical protein [Paenibacillus sp. FSL H7-0331]|uniref:hypothetical protein n=1 Tax=Paenibacillus sp. FSL H7-0331 TaxID=1920421 RepID=UPI00096C70DD|nr:hypothetical protein [Paenibacillus sp. FSL H7-0331]OMF13175.1 hypothetical protein BK127_21535 [Paenibacillus sp. FSL H7-0331]
MSTVSYSSNLHHAVRSLKELDSKQLEQMFKNVNWFEMWSISAKEAQTVFDLFSETTKSYIHKTDRADIWQ